MSAFVGQMRWLGNFLAYWSLAFKLACDEMFRGRLDPVEVDRANRLHRKLYGED